jgi:UDP-galactopyranose mutase
MKANLLILLLTIVVITTAGRIKTEMLTLDSPSISIKDVNVITSDTCKVVCYTINLYSPSRLCEFVAIPNVSEHDTVTTIEFSDHARRATVTYYYVVPRNNDSEHFDIKFFLKDNEEGKNVAELTHSL